MDKKVCSKCGDKKPINEFHKQKDSSNGFKSRCKQCRSEDGKELYKFNRERINEINNKWRKRNPEYRKEYYQKHCEEEKAYAIQYQKDNFNKVKIQKREWEKNNPEKNKAIQKRSIDKRRKTVKGRLNHQISNAIRKSLQKNKKGKSWEILVGFTLDELVRHLISTIPEGYTWDDYLAGKLHLDHRIPISIFNITSAKCKGFKACWSLDNLQLLPASENKVKSNKLFY